MANGVSNMSRVGTGYFWHWESANFPCGHKDAPEYILDCSSYFEDAYTTAASDFEFLRSIARAHKPLFNTSRNAAGELPVSLSPS